MEKIKKLIDEINSRKPKNYEQMKIEEISEELHNVMEFEQNVLEKINIFKKDHQDADLIKYLKNDLQKYSRKRNYLNSRNISKKKLIRNI